MPRTLRKNRPSAAKPARELDSLDWKILVELQRDARIPSTELGRRVGLSSSSTLERLRRLEENQVILGYRAQVDPAMLGRELQAVILVNVTNDVLPRLLASTAEMPGVLDAHRITGTESIIMKIALPKSADLEPFIDRYLKPAASTITHTILSTWVSNGIIEPWPFASTTGRKQK